jgi:hypothetical protein
MYSCACFRFFFVKPSLQKSLFGLRLSISVFCSLTLWNLDSLLTGGQERAAIQMANTKGCGRAAKKTVQVKSMVTKKILPPAYHDTEAAA